MRRTELLQEVRKMRFEEAYYGWQERRLNQSGVARLLVVWSGHFGTTSADTKKTVWKG